MPGTGGYAALEIMRKIRPSIRVLLSSGYSMDSRAAELVKEGHCGFIQKPFILRELSISLASVLRKDSKSR